MKSVKKISVLFLAENIGVEKIESFKTKDGKVFEDENKARSHQIELMFDDDFEKDRILGTYEGSYADSNDLKRWLIANSSIVKAFIDTRD